MNKISEVAKSSWRNAKADLKGAVKTTDVAEAMVESDFAYRNVPAFGVF